MTELIADGTVPAEEKKNRQERSRLQSAFDPSGRKPDDPYPAAAGLVPGGNGFFKTESMERKQIVGKPMGIKYCLKRELNL